MLRTTHSPSWHDAEWRAFGTTCRMIYSTPTHAGGADFRRDVEDWTQHFEQKYSRFQPDSVICRLNQSAGIEPVAIDAELEGIFRLCDWFHWMTGGIFDPTLLPLLRAWDYQAGQPTVPSAEQIALARTFVDWKQVQHGNGQAFLPRAGMGLDIGGIGKEYAVDRVLEMAIERGIENIMVDFGRDIRARGQPPEGGPWRIGLEDPARSGRCWSGIALADCAVATSGDYARHFVVDGRRYGHILDPRTGRPVDNGCLAVSVVAPTCTEAGILSTAAFVLGLEDGGTLLDKTPAAAGSILSRQGSFRSRDFDRYVISKHNKEYTPDRNPESVPTPQEVAS